MNGEERRVRVVYVARHDYLHQWIEQRGTQTAFKIHEKC